MDATDAVAYAEELANDARALALRDYLALQLRRVYVIPTPAAGAEFTITVPANVTWEVLSVKGVLTTSAAVANRNCTLILGPDAATTEQRYSLGTAVTASQATTFTYASGIGTTLATGSIAGPLPSPPPIAPPGYVMRSQTQNVDAGDQYSSLFVVVREWSVGQVYWLSDLIARELSFEAQHS